MEFKFVYKICRKSEWLSAIQDGKFIGTKKDIKDGYIHFSNKKKIKRTLDKYFSKQKDLILLKIETLKLDSLVWEQASDGDVFPHLYSTLDTLSICNKYDIILNEDGSYTLPPAF